jgi:RNA polymerase sigma factor (sigma-70 family)
MSNAQYRDNIRSVYKPIPHTEQVSLYKELKNGSKFARDSFIHSCLPLAYQLAKQFHVNNKHIDLEDLIQQANLALVHAVDEWDIERSSITTTVTTFITNSLINMIKDSKYRIRLKYNTSRQAAIDIGKIKQQSSNCYVEIAKETGLSVKRVKLLMNVINGKRIDFSLLNFKLHSSEHQELSETNNAKGCLADIVELVKDNCDKEDQKIFLTWIQFINHNNKYDLTADAMNYEKQVVFDSIVRTRKKLKQIIREKK